MTHDELVGRACRWLRGTKRCKPAYAEFQHMYLTEMPDAIGWTGSEVHVVEVKVSRSDFHADARKTHARSGDSMGHRRWYLVPKGLLAPEDVPEGYGLLYALPKTIKVVQQAAARTPSPQAEVAATSILRQAVLRHEGGVDWHPSAHRFSNVVGNVAPPSARGWAEVEPCYDDGVARLYRGDARAILPTLDLEGRSVVVITDPVWPNAPEGMFPGVDDPAKLFGEVAELLVGRARRLVVQLGCNSDPRFLSSVPAAFPFLRACWLRYSVPARRGTLLLSGDVAYVFGDNRPPPRPNRVLPGEVTANGRWGKGRTAHPCPRSEQHLRWLIRWFTRPGDLVLDPFAGSGTTLRAAKDYGLECIGIERDPGYCAEAAQVLAQEVLPIAGPSARKPVDDDQIDMLERLQDDERGAA